MILDVPRRDWKPVHSQPASPEALSASGPIGPHPRAIVIWRRHRARAGALVHHLRLGGGNDRCWIMLMSEDMTRGSVGSTDEVSRVIEELQYTLGEGPSIDAYELGRPVGGPTWLLPIGLGGPLSRQLRSRPAREPSSGYRS